jgi:hypothetical protein
MEQFYCNWSEKVFSEQCGNEFTVKCGYCGRILIGGEGYYQKDGKPYCEDCVESADLEDLIRICETDSHELFRSVGLTHDYVAEL